MAQLKNLVDRGSFIREVDDFPEGVVDDGVLGFAIEGKKFVRVKKGSRYDSEELGIFADGTDMTSRLQAKFNHPKIKTIVLDADGGGDITINGIVNCNGKVLEIKSGTKIVGSGEIGFGRLKADYYDHVFQTNFLMIDMYSSDEISPWWFGALANSNTSPGNGNDDTSAIQQAIDWVIYNNKCCRTIRLRKSKNGGGSYRITAPLEFIRQAGNAYQQFSLNFLGEPGTAYFGSTTYCPQIFKDFKDGFALGIQNARTSTFGGFSIFGLFAPVGATGTGSTQKQFLETKYADFADPLVPFRQTAPDCAIVIDPYTNNGTTPAAIYPGKAHRYSYATSGNYAAGSSGVVITDVRLSRHMVAVMISPNGSTRNAENITIEKIAIARCRTGFATGQDQTKGNIIRNGVCWEDCHTIFDNCTYGEKIGTMFNVDNFNIAGSVKRVFNLQVGGYFGSSFKNIYAESLIELGYINGNVKCTIEDSEFNFLNLLGGLPSSDAPVMTTGVEFKRCAFRKYGTNSRIWMSAFNCTFIDCFFERAPYLCKGASNGNSVQFINCNLSSGKLGAAPDQGQFASSSGSPNIPDCFPQGVFQLYNTTTGVKYRYNVHDYERILLTQNNVVITVNPATWEATFTPTNSALWHVGALVIHLTADIQSYEAVGNPSTTKPIAYAVLGEVKSIVGGVVTLQRVPYNIVTGTYSPWIAEPLPIGRGFIGDMSNGSAVISNVELVSGTTWPSVGQPIKFPSNGSTAAIITAVDTTAKTITVNRTSVLTSVGFAFINHEPEMIYEIPDNDGQNIGSVITSDSFLKVEGMRIIEKLRFAYNGNGLQYNNFYQVLTSGYFTPNGTTKIHQAQYKQGDVQGAVITLGNGTHTLRGFEQIVMVDATAGNVVINLTSIRGHVLGKRFTFVRIDATGNSVTVQRSGTNTIDGATSFLLTNAQPKILINDTISKWITEQPIDFNSPQAFTNKTLGAGTKINLGSVAAADMYYGDSSGNLVRVPKGSTGQVWAVISDTTLGWKNDASGSGSPSGSGIDTIRTVSSNTTFTAGDHTILVDTSAGPVSISVDVLPAGQPGWIKKITDDSNAVTITPVSGTIDGSPNYVLDGYNEPLLMKSNGTNLFIFNN